MSVPESRSFRFPKSRSKYLDDAVKLAKTLPGFEKTKKHYKVTFSKTDSGSDDLWELLKIASRWKGAVFLFDGKEVEQEVWESSFQQTSVESGEKAAVAEKPEKAEEPPKVEEKKPEKTAEPPKAEEKPEKAEEPPKVEEKPEKAEEPPKVEEKKPEKAEEPPKVEEKKPEKAEEPPKAEEKKPEKAEEKPKAEEKKPAGKPVSVQINPAPKPQENSGCGKSAAMFAIAALGLLQFFR